MLNPSLLQVTYLEATDSPSLCCWGRMGGGWGKAWLICPYAAGKAAETHTHTHTHTYMPMCHITHTHFTPLIPAHVDTAHALFINSEAGKSQTAFWVTDLHIVGLQRRPAVGGLLQWDSELQKERNESVTDTVGVTECVQAELCTGNELTSLPSPSPFTPKQLNRGARTGPCQASPLPES